MTQKKFILNIIIRYLARILVKGKELLFIYFIAKGMDVLSYGIYSQIIVTIFFLVPLLCMGFREANVRYLPYSEDKKGRKRTFFSTLWSIWLLFLLFFFIANSFRDELSIFIFGKEEYSNFIYFTFVLLFCVINFRFIINFFKASNKIVGYSVIEIIQSVLEIGILTALSLFSKLCLTDLLLVLIIVEGGMAFLMLIYIIREIGICFIHPKTLFPILLFGLPIIPSEIVSWITDASDKYFILHLIDLKNVGIYSASYKIGQISILTITPIAFVLFPLLSKLRKEENVEKVKGFMEDSIRLYIFLSFPIIVGIYKLSPYILRLIAREEFVVDRNIVAMILFGFFLLGMSKIFNLAIYLEEKTKYFLLIYILSALINLGLNFFLIPQIGIMGAAVSTLTSFLFIFLGTYIISRRLLIIKLDLKFFVKVLLASLALIAVVTPFSPSNIIQLLFVCILGLIVYIIFLFIFRGLKKRELNFVKSLFLSKGN